MTKPGGGAMVKWKKEGLVLEATLAGGRHLSVIDRRANGCDWWWVAFTDDDDDITEGEGYAPTKAQAQRCAVAVATALGWVKAEPKPERVMVDEWLEADGLSCDECRGPHKLAITERDEMGGRIVHVRRYKR